MEIHVLDSQTINRIAAGEVVERPLNVAKELIENSIDAGATAITVEIKEGGIKLLRVTDNGCGIDADMVTRAFMRHATSKIENDEDLLHLQSLGFRGEALSSIAAVAEVEMITKTKASLTGIHAQNRPSTHSDHPCDLQIDEIGAPEGTTIIVRNLFYNVPVRRKFLKQAATEAHYVTDLIEHMAMSHPDISFHYQVNGQDKLHTTGNGNLKEIISRIYGRETAQNMIPIRVETTLPNDTPDYISKKDDVERHYEIHGLVGKPDIARSTRNFESFFINGRYLTSELLSKALEEGYGTDLMQHRFPIAIVHIQLPAKEADVNVHPSKMEVRFQAGEQLYELLSTAVQSALRGKELIPSVALSNTNKFVEKNAAQATPTDVAGEPSQVTSADTAVAQSQAASTDTLDSTVATTSDTVANKPEKATHTEIFEVNRLREEGIDYNASKPEQLSMFSEDAKEEATKTRVLSKEGVRNFTWLGQIFKTYWLIEYEDQLLMIDQHAAHEKVNYERLMKRVHEEEAQGGVAPSQNLYPPCILNLTGKEEAVLSQCIEQLAKLGYQIEPFGDGSYCLRSVPLECFGSSYEELFHGILEELMQEKLTGTPQLILSKVASMSCKAAVKGNMSLNDHEAHALIEELLSLENPYHCPHGRPTMISMSRQEIEKKFKRIV